MNPFAQPETTHAWLEATCRAPVSELAYLTRGWNTRLFSFVCRGQALVLRVAQGPEQIYKEALAAQRYGQNLPIPRVWAAGHVQDQAANQIWHWAIVERCQGQNLSLLSEAVCTDLEPAVLALHLALLKQPLFQSGTGPFQVAPPHFPGFGGWQSYLSQLGGMAPRLGVLLQAPIGLTASQLDILLARLQRQIAVCPESPYWLCHGDFKAANLIADPAQGSPAITGLIDWAGMGQGDFLFDTATWIWHQSERQWASLWQCWVPVYQAEGMNLDAAPARLEAYLLFGALQAGITLAGCPSLASEIPAWREKLQFLLSASADRHFVSLQA